MIYLVGFTDYDGVQCFLSEDGFTIYPSEALWFSSKNDAAEMVKTVPRKGNGLKIFQYTMTGDLIHEE